MNDRGFHSEAPGLLRQAGRHAEALALLQHLLAGAARAGAPARPDLFLVMLEWAFLAAEYPPARMALEEARDAQIGRLLAGDMTVGPDGDTHPAFLHGSRFALIAEMNRILGDARSTYEVFVRLDAMRPDLARRHAFLALPAVVAACDFALADRYRGEPLAYLDALNATDALALRARLLAGLPSGPVRALAQRELDDEGIIMREIVAHQMAQGRLHAP